MVGAWYCPGSGKRVCIGTVNMSPKLAKVNSKWTIFPKNFLTPCCLVFYRYEKIAYFPLRKGDIPDGAFLRPWDALLLPFRQPLPNTIVNEADLFLPVGEISCPAIALWSGKKARITV
jgi:hypothetical protein